MSNELKVNIVLDKLCGYNCLFTSLDVSNYIKSRGTWIPHSKVNQITRDYMSKMHGNYNKVLIDVLVKGEFLKSYLYYSTDIYDENPAIDLYLGKYSTAITPDEFEKHFKIDKNADEFEDDEIDDGAKPATIPPSLHDSSLPMSLRPPASQEIPKIKYCPGCNANLPSTFFYKNRSKSDGLQSYCMICHKTLFYI